MVAPYAGAWIEMDCIGSFAPHDIVAPYAGAWIEMPTADNIAPSSPSRPTRARGLKSRRPPRRW